MYFKKKNTNFFVHTKKESMIKISRRREGVLNLIEFLSNFILIEGKVLCRSICN